MDLGQHLGLHGGLEEQGHAGRLAQTLVQPGECLVQVNKRNLQELAHDLVVEPAALDFGALRGELEATDALQDAGHRGARLAHDACNQIQMPALRDSLLLRGARFRQCADADRSEDVGLVQDKGGDLFAHLCVPIVLHNGGLGRLGAEHHHLALARGNYKLTRHVLRVIQAVVPGLADLRGRLLHGQLLGVVQELHEELLGRVA
mmetsp:Transcript_52157/g.139652  ORF Transcript_52157/g.139652 Transcript_52157/m.139652 type:complete len:204 (-) Transcript_52157:1324-1935(-)